MSKQSSLIVIVVVIILVGYVVIFSTTVFGDSHQIQRLSAEVIAARMQVEILKKSLVATEQELRISRQKKPKLLESEQNTNLQIVNVPQVAIGRQSVRHGVIILGMHRSGTSLVGGLINKMGLKTGGPLIEAAEDNAKGFFERIDVVLQNDYLMKRQGVHYAFQTYKYDTLIGLKDILNDDGSFFKEGKRGLKFLNDPKNYPWMLKDPRLCITFRTWLPLLNFIPAILFTYRHPLDVALSLHKREFERFEIPRGLRIWYVYNRRAVQQSEDLCRVVTSHHRVMVQPQVEFDRIYDELRYCGVDVPHKLTLSDVASFIDIKLQHGQSTLKDTVCEQDTSNINPPDSWKPSNDNQLKLYREVMRVYCALENRSAFRKGFAWDESIHDG